MTRLMIMAGGTGGHVIPALAVASELMRRDVTVSWLGTRQGLESRLVPEAKIDFDEIAIKGLRGSSIFRKAAMPAMILRAMLQAFVVIRSRNPDVVLGMGGFVAGPGGLVAAMLRKPIVLHEQNTVAGLTNRWLAKLSRSILTGFPEAQGLRHFQWVGNPVTESVRQIKEPGVRIFERRGALRVLVAGGSQGASVFNEHLPELLKESSARHIEVWHQCGKQTEEEALAARYRQCGIACRVTVFINNMADAYAWSDIVICRAGAMTISEICCAGVCAMFVPYPLAVDDHQTRNAAYLCSRNAAIMASQEDFLRGTWLPQFNQLAASSERRRELAVAAHALARPNAAAVVADKCMEVCGA